MGQFLKGLAKATVGVLGRCLYQLYVIAWDRVSFAIDTLLCRCVFIRAQHKRLLLAKMVVPAGPDNPRIMSPLLYQLSYGTMLVGSEGLEPSRAMPAGT